MSKKKKEINETPKQNITLGEFAANYGVSETFLAGFKVWLVKASARTYEQWVKDYRKFLKS